jgi:hypothetical protein
MISEKDKTNICDAAHSVWDYIGHDILDAVKLEKELNPNANTDEPLTMSKDEVIEVVLDAGRLDEHLKEQNQWVLGMENLSLNEWINLVKPAFPFDTYGK